MTYEEDIQDRLIRVEEKLDKLIEHLMPKPKGKDQEDKTEKILKKKGQNIEDRPHGVHSVN